MLRAAGRASSSKAAKDDKGNADCDGAWQPWTVCSASCGSTGTRVRTFARDSSNSNGNSSSGDDDSDEQGEDDCAIAQGDIEIGTCDMQVSDDDGNVTTVLPCPADCVGAWSAWSECATEACGSDGVRRLSLIHI